MIMKALVIYTSQTGFAKKYAGWISEALNADIYDLKDVQNKKADFFDVYEAIIYADAPDASGLAGDEYNPQAYTITKKKVTSKSVLKLKMAPCGGFAISIREY